MTSLQREANKKQKLTEKGEEEEPKGRLPVLFVCHGAGPMLALCANGVQGYEHHEELVARLKYLAASVEQSCIRAILCVSAHLDDRSVPTLCSSPNPMAVCDYDPEHRSFPEEAFRMEYSAPGGPDVAKRAHGLISAAGIKCELDDKAGWDHGCWVPISVMFPGAVIPVVEMGICNGSSPDAHAHLGRALAPLRDEGVLIIGSGMTYHNLGYMNGFTRTLKATGKPPDVATSPESEVFDEWLKQAICSHTGATRLQEATQWETAPCSLDAFPQKQRPAAGGDDYHMMPLFTCVGAAYDDEATVVAETVLLGCKLSSFVFSGAPMESQYSHI
jgi:aromatic ring-opening dioxygenase catalytic subunit (LigB family)